jgi:hypothetical protein
MECTNGASHRFYVFFKLRKMQQERTEWIIEHIEKSDYDIILLQECFDNKFIDAAQDRLAKEISPLSTS